MAGEATGLNWIPEPADATGIKADFYSDMKTKPTEGMLRALLNAEVGDEQKGEDPTTNALCDRVAELTGKEAATLLPTETMCNEIALRVHCDPGDEVICDRSCHIVNFEAGGPAALSGVMINPLDGENGMFTVDQVRQAIRPASRYAPTSRLLAVEQTTNLGGGGVWPLKQLTDVAELAKSRGFSTHMDGARLFNATVQSGIAARDYAKPFDSIWIDLSNGAAGSANRATSPRRDFTRSITISTDWRKTMPWPARSARTSLRWTMWRRFSRWRRISSFSRSRETVPPPPRLSPRCYGTVSGSACSATGRSGSSAIWT
jgi:threonine aldolase